MVVVLDDTRPADQYVMGPGDLRSHAYPDGALVSLCGRVRREDAPQGHCVKCGLCLALTRQRNWVAR
jgi:hypothetical protein